MDTTGLCLLHSTTQKGKYESAACSESRWDSGKSEIELRQPLTNVLSQKPTVRLACRGV